MAELNVTAQDASVPFCQICDIEIGCLTDIHYNLGIVLLKEKNGDIIISIPITNINHRPAVVRDLHERCTNAGFVFVPRADADTDHLTYQHPEDRQNIPNHALVTGIVKEFVFPLIGFDPYEIIRAFQQKEATLSDNFPGGYSTSSSSPELSTMSEPQNLKRAASKQPSNTPKRSTKATAADKILADPEAVLENEKSPIYAESLNLKAVLTHPKAQEVLLKAGIDLNKLPSEDLNSAIAQFKEDGRSGRYDPDWLAQAIEASKIRQAGGFDEYQKAKFKEDWDIDDEDFKEETEMQAKVANGQKMSCTVTDSEVEGDKDEFMDESEVAGGGGGQVEKIEKGEMVDGDGDKAMNGLA